MHYCLNISPAKTGNSFIQQFLKRQTMALERQKIFFMGNTYAPHQPHYKMVEPISRAIREGEMDKPKLLTKAKSYFDFVNPNKYDTIVQMITGGIMGGDPQNFTVNKTLASLMAIKYLTMGHNVRVVCIVRRQDKLLESRYLQTIQGGASMPFAEFMTQVDIEAISWKKLVDIAEDVFGEDNVIVFPFETIYSGEKEFLRRFISCFADPNVFNYSNLDIPKNRSYSEVALQLALVGNRLLESEERKLLRGFLQKHFSNSTHSRAKLMNPEQSYEILKIHALGNKELFKKYCPKDDPTSLGYIPS